MRHVYASTIFLILLMALSACRSGGTLPAGTFVNQSDPTQVLQLTVDPAQTLNPFVRISIKTGANKYVGKSVGTYELRKNQEVTSGTFRWRMISTELVVHEIWLKTANGQDWSLQVRPDNSLVGPDGVVWRHA